MAQLQTYRQSNYDGGLNNTANSSEIGPTEASVLHDWDITFQGQLKRRDGLTLAGSAISANPISGLGAFLRNGGNDLLAMETTNLYYLNGATWTKIANNFTNTAGLAYWIENIQDLGKVYIANEDNVLTSWDRSSTTLNTCLTAQASSVPHGNVLKWHKNHLFAANNVNVSGTKYPNRLYWSAVGDPTTWTTASDYIEVAGDGRVVGLGDLGNNLVIFKERAIQFLSGYGDTDWQITSSSSNVSSISEEVGCVSPRGFTRVGNQLWFVDQYGNVRTLYQTDYGLYQTGFDPFRKDIMSMKIQGTLAGLNRGQLSQCIATTWNNKVYFAFPNGTDTHNSIVCVFDILTSRRTQDEAWTTYTGWTPGLFAQYPTAGTPDLYIGDATTGNVYRHAGLDDNGIAIAAQWDSKDDNFGAAELWKRYKFGYIRAQALSGSASFTVQQGVDQGAYNQPTTISLQSTGSDLGPTGSFLLGPTGNNELGGSGTVLAKFFTASGGGSARGRYIRTSIRHNIAGQQPIVGTYTIHYKPRVLR